LGWLGAATGYREVVLGEPGRDDDHLQISRLLDQRERFVAHQHVLASPSVRRLVRTFDLRVIVQTRDVADSVVSFCDHLGKEPTNPIFKLPRGFDEMERPDQLRLVASVFAPWVMAFVSSWESAARAGIPVTWVSFDDVVTSPAETIRRCVAATDLPSDAQAISRAAERPVRRLNVGGGGRGRSEIPLDTLRWMDALVGYYRLADPTRIMAPTVPAGSPREQDDGS
jgi:hypothetical protein